MWRLVSMTLALSFSGLPGALAETSWQPHESILSSIRVFMESNFRHLENGLTIDVASLDHRLRLPLCSSELTVFAPSGLRESGHMSVGVKCEGEQPWTIYNKVSIRLTREVAVLRTAVRQGAVLSADDLTVVKKDVSQLRGGFLNPLQAIGRSLRKPAAAGMVLTPDHIANPKLIARGQGVAIKAEGIAFEVSMPGTAMADGEAGERIRVRNEVSGRVVEATVADRETVLVSR
jgi:flagellar basal body P-ring formation protein FlgA